jgi:hypothetical protein
LNASRVLPAQNLLGREQGRHQMSGKVPFFQWGFSRQDLDKARVKKMAPGKSSHTAGQYGYIIVVTHAAFKLIKAYDYILVNGFQVLKYVSRLLK